MDECNEGVLWPSVGATSRGLMAFPGATSRLDHAVIDTLSGAVEHRVYHPEHSELVNPFSKHS
jgi:hypothetical protein